MAALNPDQPSNIATLSADSLRWWCTSIAIGNNNQAYTPCGKVDLKTMTVDRTVGLFNGYLRAAADGSRIYGVGTSEVFALDPATDTWSSEMFGSMSWSDLAVAPDGSQFAAILGSNKATGFDVGFFDHEHRLVGWNSYPTLSFPTGTQVIGGTYSPGANVRCFRPAIRWNSLTRRPADCTPD